MRIIVRHGSRVIEIYEQEFTGRGNMAKQSRDAIVRSITAGYAIELQSLEMPDYNTGAQGAD